MKIYAIILFVAFGFVPVSYAESAKNGKQYVAENSVLDNESLQRGAKIFAKSCLSCHSAKLVRFKRIADDLNWNPEQVSKFVARYSKTPKGDWFNNMVSPMPESIANNIFGIVPPDVSLIARYKGSDYLLSYLLNYYQDSNQTFGSNNALLQGTAMPNVLIGMQGTRTPIYDKTHTKQITGYTQLKAGSMTEEEFYASMTDLVNFLEYISEPAQIKRLQLGWIVILFTLLMAVSAYFLKRNYWQDVK